MPNIPSPEEVINNVDRYRQQISAVMGLKGLVSNEVRASNAIKNYFNALGEFLGIETTEIDINNMMNSTQMTSSSSPSVLSTPIEEHIKINFLRGRPGNSFVKSFISRFVHCEFASIVFFVTHIQKRFSLIEDIISILHNIVFSA
jgi:hypothetical protein